MEIAVAYYDKGLVLGYSLDLVAPAAGKLERGFDGFSSGIHGEKLVVAEELGGELLIRAEAVVVEGPGGETQFLCLISESLYDLGVAMPLVDSRIG